LQGNGSRGTESKGLPICSRRPRTVQPPRHERRCWRCTVRSRWTCERRPNCWAACQRWRRCSTGIRRTSSLSNGCQSSGCCLARQTTEGSSPSPKRTRSLAGRTARIHPDRVATFRAVQGSGRSDNQPHRHRGTQPFGSIAAGARTPLDRARCGVGKRVSVICVAPAGEGPASAGIDTRDGPSLVGTEFGAPGAIRIIADSATATPNTVCL